MNLTDPNNQILTNTNPTSKSDSANDIFTSHLSEEIRPTTTNSYTAASQQISTNTLNDDLAKAKIRCYLELVRIVELIKLELSTRKISIEEARNRLKQAKLTFDNNIHGI